jgi:hypothetical protein
MAMDNKLVPTANDIINGNEAKSSEQRQLAANLNERGELEVYYSPIADTMEYSKVVALQVFDAIVHGQVEFSNGKALQITEFRDWMDIVKFLHQHMDGPAAPEAVTQNFNLFKVYAGIDMDKV